VKHDAEIHDIHVSTAGLTADHSIMSKQGSSVGYNWNTTCQPSPKDNLPIISAESISQRAKSKEKIKPSLGGRIDQALVTKNCKKI